MPTPPSRAADFLNGLGVNTHMHYTDGGYVKLGDVEKDLAYLGINHVRDGVLDPTSVYPGPQDYDALASTGVRFNMVVDGSKPLATTMTNLDNFVTAHPGALVSIEGPNEVNNWPVSYDGKTGTEGAIAFQNALYAAVHADPKLAGIPVLNFTDYPQHSGAADSANAHAYAWNGDQPGETLAYAAAVTTADFPGKPLQFTETGYYTLPGDTRGWGGPDDATQARVLLNTVFDTAKLGADHTYIYQLLDAYQDPDSSDQEKHFGLFDVANQPKPSAVAFHNLTTILADTAADATTFRATPLSYTLTGLPTTGSSLALAKADGSTTIAVWAEPDIWDQQAHRPIASAVSPVTVNLGGNHQSVAVYDPLVGTDPVQTFNNVSQVTLAVTDHPLLVRVSADAPVAHSTAVSNTIGSGLDTLVLRVSQDAYQGDAQYTVTVDGRQVGGTQTAHASHAAGQDDILTVKGDWTAGNHQVAVNFLNDAWGGTPDTDRNLYLDAASYNGAAVTGAAHALYSTGATAFSVRDTTGASGSITRVGNGSDILALQVSQDAYQGDAQFLVTVDGKQIGGVQTAHALHGSGAEDVLLIGGNWGSGSHQVGVKFVNDLYGGTAAADRNLYVGGVNYDGVAQPGSHADLFSNGNASFTVADHTALPVNTLTMGSGAHTLTLQLSEDAWQGDASYTVAVDGKQVSGSQVAHASHAAGAVELVLAQGDWAPGSHQVTVNFLNDAYGGSPSSDRNLYVVSAAYDGVVVPDAAHSLMSAGPVSFAVHDALVPADLGISFA